MNVSGRCVRFVAGFEGFRSRPYRDAVGVWTIGYGETAGVGPNTLPVTEAQALRKLRQRLDRDFASSVRALRLPLSQRQFDALVSAVYNLGPGVLGAGHSLGDALRARHYAQAANALLLYDMAGGRHLPGLTRRRRAERRMFLRGSSPWIQVRAALLLRRKR